jgi:hypothetical protein
MKRSKCLWELQNISLILYQNQLILPDDDDDDDDDAMKTETIWICNKTISFYTFRRLPLTIILHLFLYLLHYVGCHIYL